MSVQNFSPDADPETTSVDGYVGPTSQNLSFSAIRAATGTYASPAENIIFLALYATATTDRYQILYRGIITIDVSGFTGGSDNITGITFNLYLQYVGATFTFATALALVNSTPTTNTNVVTADYLLTGTTRQASDVSLSGLTAGNWIQFTLNATGIAAVKTAIAGAGIYKMGLVWKEDVDATAITWSSAKEDAIQFRSADYTGATIPYLAITYTSSAIKTVNGLAKASVGTINGLAIASVKTWNGLT